ncbi:hypothetical protein DMC01_08315 [Campylobacter troglodytis]|nr:hypothetical protein DMC01_08315 [Campylobacter troglodytis]
MFRKKLFLPWFLPNNPTNRFFTQIQDDKFIGQIKLLLNKALEKFKQNLVFKIWILRKFYYNVLNFI